MSTTHLRAIASSSLATFLEVDNVSSPLTNLSANIDDDRLIRSSPCTCNQFTFVRKMSKTIAATPMLILPTSNNTFVALFQPAYSPSPRPHLGLQLSLYVPLILAPFLTLNSFIPFLLSSSLSSLSRPCLAMLSGVG